MQASCRSQLSYPQIHQIFWTVKHKIVSVFNMNKMHLFICTYELSILLVTVTLKNLLHFGIDSIKIWPWHWEAHARCWSPNNLCVCGGGGCVFEKESKEKREKVSLCVYIYVPKKKRENVCMCVCNLTNSWMVGSANKLMAPKPFEANASKLIYIITHAIKEAQK